MISKQLMSLESDKYGEGYDVIVTVTVTATVTVTVTVTVSNTYDVVMIGSRLFSHGLLSVPFFASVIESVLVAKLIMIFYRSIQNSLST